MREFTRSTVSFRRLMWRLAFGFTTGLILLCAACAVFAQTKPPRFLIEHLSSHPVLHSKRCDAAFIGIKDVKCVVLFDSANDSLWIVLYDGEQNITHIVRDKKGKEQLIWCTTQRCS